MASNCLISRNTCPQGCSSKAWFSLSVFSPKLERKLTNLNYGPHRSQNGVRQGGIRSLSSGDYQASCLCSFLHRVSIFSLHIGCLHGVSYSCFPAIGSMHGALGYHGGDLVLTLHLLWPQCLLVGIFKRKIPIGSVFIRCSLLVQSAVPRDTYTHKVGIPDVSTTQDEL